MRCFGDKARTYHCKVVLLDEQELIQEVQDATTGQDLLDVVLQHLNLLETAYFGLRFLDPENHTHWLDPTKRLMKQLKGTSPFTLYFSVKFYAADPTKLVEEITRYQFFLQVKQDILQGRLPITLEMAAELGAYAVQSELGDYDPRRHSPGYVSEFRFIAGQTVSLETKIAELHKKLVGQVPAKAELNYLEKVKWLEMYGVDLHPVLGEDNIEYFLGLTPSGAIVLRNKTKVGNYFWPRITKVYFRGRFFMLRVRDKNNSENTYGFETPSRAACKHLWQCCVEHHAFFRLTQSAGSGPQAVFSLGSKFRYSGRTEKEVMQEARSSSRQQPEVTRTPSRRYQRRVVEGAVDTPRIEDADPKIEPRVQMPSAPVAPLASSNVYRSTSMTLNGRGPSSPRSIRSAPQQASSSSSVPPIGRTRLDENKSSNRAETRSESTGPGNRADSPRSVRSAAPAIAVDSRMSRRTSSVDSQSSIDSRGHRRHRRRSRCRSSDGESEVSSKCSSRGHRRHHHRHKHHHRHHSDDSSEHKHKHRRHRHKSSDSTKKLVESDEQWARVQAGESQVRGKAATVRDLSSRSGYEPSIDTENDSQHHSGKRRHRKHRSRSRSPNEVKNSRYPAELRQHIDYGLKDTNGLTEAELRDIPYTRVETATNVKTKFATTGTGKKHKSPRRSKSNSSDRKLAPPDGESPPPSYQDSTKKHHHHSSSRKKNKSSSEERKVEGESRGDPTEDLRSVALPQNSFPRIAPSGESSTPPPPPSSVPPSKYDSNVTQALPYDGRSPVSFPGYIPNTRGVGGQTNSLAHTSFRNHEPLVTSSPSVKNLVTGNGFVNSNGGFTYHGPDSSSSNSFSSDINCSPSPPHPNMTDRRHPNMNGNDQYLRNDYGQGISNGYASNRSGFIQTTASFLKPSTLERGTRGSSINKPQPSPQSSVTSGISVGGSSTSTTIMEEEEPSPFAMAETYSLEGVNINSSFASQNTSYTSQDSGKSGQLCSSDSGQQHSSDSLQSSTGSSIVAGMRSSVNNKPTVPGNKPPLRTRPHSVHGGIPGETNYSHGSIITQITDQDGYRATRVPISEPQSNSGRNYNERFQNPGEKGADFSSFDANVKYSTLNSTQNFNGRFQAIHDGNVNINNKNESIVRSQSLQRSNSSARYSYPNVNGNSNGVLVKNLMNQSSNHVGDMVAKLNGQPSTGLSNGLSPVTSPNGNTSHLGSHKSGEFVLTNQRDRNIDHNKSREEVSTEL